MKIRYICDICDKNFITKKECLKHEKKCAHCFGCKNKIKVGFGYGYICKLNHEFTIAVRKCPDFIKDF